MLELGKGKGRGKAPKKGFLKPPHARALCKSRYARLQRKTRPANQAQSEPAACFAVWLEKLEICENDLKMREKCLCVYVCVCPFRGELKKKWERQALAFRLQIVLKLIWECLWERGVTGDGGGWRWRKGWDFSDEGGRARKKRKGVVVVVVVVGGGSIIAKGRWANKSNIKNVSTVAVLAHAN